MDDETVCLLSTKLKVEISLRDIREKLARKNLCALSDEVQELVFEKASTEISVPDYNKDVDKVVSSEDSNEKIDSPGLLPHENNKVIIKQESVANQDYSTTSKMAAIVGVDTITPHTNVNAKSTAADQFFTDSEKVGIHEDNNINGKNNVVKRSAEIVNKDIKIDPHQLRLENFRLKVC